MKSRMSLANGILLVSNYPSDTGYAWWLMEHFWSRLAALYAEQGGVGVVAYPAITRRPALADQPGVTIIEQEVLRPGSGSLASLRRVIRHHRVKAVYLTDRGWFHPGYLLLRWWGVRTIVVHDHTPGDRPPIGGIKGWVKALRNRLPWFCADYQFVVSPLMRQRSLENARIPAGRVLVVQNGVSPPAPEVTRETMRRTLGIDEDSLVVISTGRVHPYKRHDMIVDIADRLRQREPGLKVVWVIVGDGPALAEVREKVEQLRLDSVVRLLGFRQDTSSLLGMADVALHPALGEGFSLSIVEYMAAGLPVLVPDIPSVSQAIEHGKTGLIHGRDDVDEAVGQLLSLANDPEQRRRMGEQAQQVARSRYSLAECTAAFERTARRAFGLR